MAADPDASAVVEPLVGDPRRLAAMAADEHLLADGQRLGEIEDPALLDLRHPVRRTGALARLRVALGDVDALDDDRRGRQRRRPDEARAVLGLGLLETLRAADHAVDDAALAGGLADEDHDRIAGPDLGDLRGPRRRPVNGHHSTSGASETIFM